MRAINLVIDGNRDLLNSEVKLVYIVIAICAVMEIFVVFFGIY